MTPPRLPDHAAGSRAAGLRAALLTAAVLAVAALAGCSSDEHAGMPGMDGTSAAPSSAAAPGSSSPAGAHGDADVSFLSGMVPHHQQAVEMSSMLLAKQGVDPDVSALATRIKAAQAPEIARMSGWLAGWGEDPSPSAMSGMPGMDHGDGMMSQADMDALDKATGADAAELFLTGMVRHHQGAVTMAQTELDQGQSADAKQLARHIVTTQKSEITEMNRLLGR